MKGAIEVVEHLETSASLTAHAGISFFEKGSLPGGTVSPDPPSHKPWGSTKTARQAIPV
jgi:hypothetical protein